MDHLDPKSRQHARNALPILANKFCNTLYTLVSKNEIGEKKAFTYCMQHGTMGAGRPEVNRLANFDCSVIREQEVSVFILRRR